MVETSEPVMEATLPVTLDDVLANEIGQFGWYQLRNIVLLALPIMASAFKTDYIFTTARIPHRCQIPECGENSSLYQYNPDWILNAIPEASSGFSSCQRYLPLTVTSNETDQCPASMFNQSEIINCESYVYAANNTIVYDFNLGCQDWLRVLPGSLSSFGLILGLPITGYISDRFGRRFALIFNVLGMGVVGVIRAFSINYSMFMALQLLQTCLGAGVYSSAFIIAVELIGPKYRAITSACTTSMFSIGEMVLGGAAWAIPSWRRMSMILYSPFILILAYFWILPDSIRWLLSKKKYTRAKKYLQIAAKLNEKHVSEKSLAALTSPIEATVSPQTKVKAPNLCRSVIQSSVLLRRVCTTPVWWITTTLVYYGLSINSTNFSSTLYLNYILTCAIEIPGSFTGVLFVDIIGRKTTLSLGFFFSSLCNISFVFIPSAYSTIRLLVYMLGKFGISAVMMMLYLYTSELYPTIYRHSLLAFSSTVGRIGSLVAPLTPVLATYWHGTPNMIFGLMCIISGFLALTQPETLGAKLPDTLLDAEALGKSESKIKQTN